MINIYATQATITPEDSETIIVSIDGANLKEFLGELTPDEKQEILAQFEYSEVIEYFDLGSEA